MPLDPRGLRAGDGRPPPFFRHWLGELIEYARWEARLARKPKDGLGPERAHLAELAKRGHVVAKAQLEGPRFPEPLRPLWDCFQQLHLMRGVGFSGPARLTPGDIAGADRLFQWHLAPHEVEALTMLDLVTLYPDPPKPKDNG